MKHVRFQVAVLLLAVVAASLGGRSIFAATAEEIDKGVDEALKTLYEKDAEAKKLGEQAKGVLVFPDVVKAGFLGGGAIGEGALRVGGKTVGYYHSLAASYGFQAGIQWYAYACFLMTDRALEYVEDTKGWELGAAPGFVLFNKGMAKNLTTTTAHNEIVGYVFDQKGLMAGGGIQGSKITKIEK